MVESGVAIAARFLWNALVEGKIFKLWLLSFRV